MHGVTPPWLLIWNSKYSFHSGADAYGTSSVSFLCDLMSYKFYDTLRFSRPINGHVKNDWDASWCLRKDLELLKYFLVLKYCQAERESLFVSMSLASRGNKLNGASPECELPPPRALYVCAGSYGCVRLFVAYTPILGLRAQSREVNMYEWWIINAQD